MLTDLLCNIILENYKPSVNIWIEDNCNKNLSGEEWKKSKIFHI